jgi:tight adherence protein B
VAGVVTVVAPSVDALPAGVAVVLVAVAVARAAQLQRAHRVVLRLDGPPVPPVPPVWFRQALDLSGLTVGPDVAWRWTARGGGAVVAVVAWHRPVLTAGLAAGGAGVVLVRRRLHQRVRHRAQHHHLAAVIDVVLFRLAAGASLASALESASTDPTPLAADLHRVAARIGHGLGVQAAVDEWAVTSGSAGVRLLADAVAIAGASGGSQQAALLGVQATLRDRDALAREVRALATQARTSGVVLVLTPIGFASVVALVDPRVAQFFATPAGWGCVAVGLALDATGAAWMNRLARAVE